MMKMTMNTLVFKLLLVPTSLKIIVPLQISLLQLFCIFGNKSFKQRPRPNSLNDEWLSFQIESPQPFSSCLPNGQVV
jgi:hypothetical protein